VTELELHRQVVMLAARHDVQLHHAHHPVRDRPGFPDLVLLGTAAAAFRELKSERGRLSPEQQQMGARSAAAGLDFDVWRPSDLENGRIELEIAALSGKRPWTRSPR
jgi:hypothetical protein